MGVYSGNRTLLGESMEVDNTGHVLDFVIECERNELKLFDAVLGCDMIHAYTEAGLTTLTLNEAEEAEKSSEKSLGTKIKELFEKAIAAVKRFVSTFIAKISNLFNNDAKLIKKYGKNFANNAAGYVLKFSWRKPNYKVFTNPETIISDMFSSDMGEGRVQDYDTVINVVGRCSSTDAINEEIERYKKESKGKDIYAIVDKQLFASKKAEEDYKLDNNDADQIFKAMSSSTRFINTVKRMGNYTIKELKEKQSNLKASSKFTENDLGLAKLNGMYKAGSIYIKDVQKLLNATLSALTRILASCRKVFVAVGKNAGETKATNEAATLYDNLLAEASDNYVIQSLDMTM